MSSMYRDLFLLLFLAAPTILFGQVTTTSIVGTVTDPGGAAIPNSTEVATDTDRGQSKSAQTGSITGAGTVRQLQFGGKLSF